MALTKTQVSELYVAIFNRASEGSGNKNWQQYADAKAAADIMLESDAAKEYFGTSLLTDAAFVEHIYKNTLNKGGADVDAAGKAGWVEYLKGHTRGEMVAEMIEAIKEYQVGGSKYATADQATKDAAQQFDNRVKVSDYAADNLETIAVSEIDSTLSFGGALNVTADPATITTAEAAIDATNPANVGETFTLTTSPEVVIGTALNDTIEGVVSALSSEKTLYATDVIDGGAGTDTAKFDLKTSFNGFTGDGKMTNVENVELTNEGTVARTFTGTGTTGVEKYTLNGAVNLASMTEISTVEASDRTDNLTVTYASKVTDGKADEMTLALNNVGTAEDESTTAIEEKAVKATIAGIETVNVEAKGVNVVNLDGVAAKAITASGEGSLKIEDVNALTKTIDASGMTGNVDLAMATADSATLVSTGSGDDKVTVNIASDLTANATVAGGAGDDTLVLTGAATIQYTQSGFETIEVGAGAKTISLKNTEDLANITVNKNADAINTLASAGAIDLAVSIQGANANSASVDSDHSGATTINVEKPTKAGTSTTNNTSATLSKSTSLNMTVAEDMVYTGTVTAGKATSVEMAINGTVGTTAKVVAGVATSAVISSVANDSALILDTVKLTDLNITNAKNLKLSGSTLTGVETLTTAGAGGLDLSTVTAVNLTSLNTATIANTGEIKLANVGLNTQEYALSVTSEDSKSFDIGTMTTKDQAITLNVIDSLGAIKVDVINAGKGDVNVTLSGASTAAVKAITGKAVTFDASGVLGNMTYGGAITATGNVTFIGSELKANDLSTSSSIDLQGTAQTVSLTGGLAVDTFKITDTTMNSTTITVTGDLGADTGDNINITTTTGAQTIDISGLKNYDTAVINAGVGADTIKLGAGKDTVQIADASVDSTAAAMDSITGFTIGAGNDTINLATATIGTTASGSVTFKVASDVSAAAGTTDGINTGMFTFDKAAATSLSDAITKVGAVVKAAGEAVIFEYAGDTYFFADTDGATVTTSDLVIKLVGVDSTSMSETGEVFTIA